MGLGATSLYLTPRISSGLGQGMASQATQSRIRVLDDLWREMYALVLSVRVDSEPLNFQIADVCTNNP